MSAIDGELVQVAAGELEPGAMLVLGRGEWRRVLRVERYDELLGAAAGPRVRVIVAGGSSEAWEGARSGHTGARSIALPEMGLRPFEPGERLTVARG